MSYDEIKLEYPLAEDMVQIFNTSREKLQDVMQEMMSISTTLEEGALLGLGGEAYVESIRGKLCPSISELTEKMDELAKDVQAAIQAMRDADESSRRQFGN